MAKIGSFDGAPVYESIDEVEDLSQPWFVIPPQAEPTDDDQAGSWDGWTEMGATTDSD